MLPMRRRSYASMRRRPAVAKAAKPVTVNPLKPLAPQGPAGETMVAPRANVVPCWKCGIYHDRGCPQVFNAPVFR
jgi:hypothetical protein